MRPSDPSTLVAIASLNKWKASFVGLEVIALSAALLAGRQTDPALNRTEWKRAFWIAFAPNALVLCIGAYSVFYALL